MAKDDKLLEEARKRFKAASEAEQAQREVILKAKQFRAGDQWDPAVKLQRQGGPAISGQAAQPPRPCLTIDRLSQPVRQTSNAIRAANYSWTFVPNGHGADDETAKIYKGLARRIQNQARSEDPVSWAADGAAEGGLGWFRIVTRYVRTPKGYVGPEVFDQEVCLARVANSLTVYCDPFAQKPTKADARYMIVTEDISKDEAKRRFKLDADDMATLDEFMTTGDDDTGWVKEDSVRIADYYRLVDEDEVIYELPDGQMVPKTQLPDDFDEKEAVRTRTRSNTTVKVSKICATKELEKATFPGSRIPLIPILGEELNVDGKSIYLGIITRGMDGQRMVNYTYSGAIETYALLPKSPIMIAEGQLEGYEKLWQTANTFNYSYLPYKPTTSAGTLVPPPMRAPTDAGSSIEAAVALMMKSEEAIKVTTGVFDPSLGKSDPNLKTARATLAVIEQAEQGHSNYLDNTRRALLDAGEIFTEIFPIVYDRPGRIIDILGIDDKAEQVMLGQPFQQGPQGVPQPVEGQVEADAIKKGLIKFYDLTKGQYAVTVDVGKAHATAREEGNEMMGNLIPHMPPPMQMAVLPSFIENQNFEGAHEMAELMRKTLPPELQSTKEGEGPNVVELQQQMAKMQKVMQVMTQELEAKTRALETDQIKMQGQAQIRQLQEQGDSEREQMKAQIKTAEIAAQERQSALDNLVKLAIAEINAEAQEAKIHAEMARDELGFRHEHAQKAQDRAFEGNEAERGRQFEGDQSERDRLVGASESDTNRGFEADQADQTRAFDASQAEADRALQAEQAALAASQQQGPA